MAAPVGINARQYLTIMFSDLSGSTDIAAAMEPESYAELLGELRQMFATIVPRHGGEIIRIDGDGVLCIFGYPASHEDAGRRAVEAAMDLHVAATALDQNFAPQGMPVRLHSGIHSGVVLLRSGDLVRGRFEVLGDATNIAAKLCDQAAADTVIVGEQTLGADQNFFRTGPRRLVDFGGRIGRLAVVDVLDRALVATRFEARTRRGVAPFSGRVAELTRLDDALARCTPSRPQLAAIIGAAGIGKTRLASEFIDIARSKGVAVLRGYCEAYLGAKPLQPFVQVLHAILAAHTPSNDKPASPAEQLAHLCPELLSPLMSMLSLNTGEAEPHPPGSEALIPAMRKLFEQTALHTPTLCFIDDWQWADDASRRMLEILVETLHAPVLFLLSSRSIDLSLMHDGTDGIIEVPPLASEEAIATIQSLIDSTDPFLVKRLSDYAGGSPLFIEELCLALRNGDDMIVHPDRSNWLDLLIQARFARLHPDQAAQVKTAAVIGHIIPTWLFEALTGVGLQSPDLESLAADDFLYLGEVPGTLRFKHGITRDAVYRTIGLNQRDALHRLVVDALHARALETGEDEQFEALAHHYAACGNHERALHFALLAGAKALKASALDRAQALYQAALDALLLLEDTPERTRQANEIAQKYGLASVFDPAPEQLPTLQTLVALAQARSNIEGLILAQLWLGVIHYGLGNALPSIRHLEAALAASAGQANVRLLNQIKANLGQSHLAAAHCNIAAKLLDEVIAAMRDAGRDGRFTGLPYVLCCRGFLCADQGDFGAAAGYYAQVEALLAGSEPPMFGSYITQVAAVAIWEGDYAAALGAATRGIALAERTRSRYFMMMSRALAAYASWRATHDAAAIDQLVDASQWFISGASQQRSSLLFGWLAEIMAGRGDVGLARFYAAKALRRARTGDRLGETCAYRGLEILAAQGHMRHDAGTYRARGIASALLRGSLRDAALTHDCTAVASGCE